MKRPRAAALDDARVDALLAPLARARATLIAVSGGPDSTALLVMASEWAARRGARLFAATVDPGLRPESASEAAGVAALAARLGVPHATLAWEGPKPATRRQERAREARYRLLAAHAKAIGAEAIATAHHLDDQAETVLFRLLRGSGVAGLAGMAPQSERHGVILARPLLGVPKAGLAAFCRARGVAFVEDPSNADPAYARTRLRALMGALAEEGLDAEGVARLARRAAEAEAALVRMTDAAEARLGAAPIEAPALFAEPIAVVHRLLARRIAAAGGWEEARIALEKVETLAARLGGAAAEGRPLAANVGGALVRLTAKGKLEFVREPARRSNPAAASPDPWSADGAGEEDKPRRGGG